MCASRNRRTAIVVKLLLEAGAEKEAKDGVRESKRARSTRTLTHEAEKMVKRVYTMRPLPIVVTVASTCAAWGLA